MPRREICLTSLLLAWVAAPQVAEHWVQLDQVNNWQLLDFNKDLFVVVWPNLGDFVVETEDSFAAGERVLCVDVVFFVSFGEGCFERYEDVGWNLSVM